MDDDLTPDDDRYDLPLEPDVGRAADVEDENRKTKNRNWPPTTGDLAEVNEAITNLYRYVPLRAPRIRTGQAVTGRPHRSR